MGVYLVVCIIYLFIFFSILTSTYLLIVRVESLFLLVTYMVTYMLGRNPLDEGSARRRDLCLTIHNT